MSVERHGLPWHIPHVGPRAGYTFQPTPIHDAAEGRAAADELLTAADPRLAGEPRRVGGDRRRRTGLLGPVLGR